MSCCDYSYSRLVFSFNKKIIFSYVSTKNIWCGYSLEAPHQGASNEYPQHMFSRNNKNIFPIPPPHLELCLLAVSHLFFCRRSLYQLTPSILMSISCQPEVGGLTKFSMIYNWDKTKNWLDFDHSSRKTEKKKKKKKITGVTWGGGGHPFSLKHNNYIIIDCRYSLELPRRSGSNEYLQSMI